MKKHLQVMKFGGTSVGDASCISRVCEIVKDASRDYSVLVVVSAMSGVTNRLIEAATRAEAGERDNAALLIDSLRKQHEIALNALIHDADTRKRLSARIEELLKEATRLCDGTALIRELTPRTLDSVSSLGERLSAPLVAAALKECGVETEAVEATELIVTDGYHGAAEPAIDRTRERCEDPLAAFAAAGNRAGRHRFHRRHAGRRSHHPGPRRFRLFRHDSGRGDSPRMKSLSGPT